MSKKNFTHSNPTFQKLIDQGERLRSGMLSLLENRPSQYRSDDSFRERTDDLNYEVQRWINEVVTIVGAFTVHPTSSFQSTANSMIAALFHEEQQDPKRVLNIYTDQVLSWISSAVDPVSLPSWVNPTRSLSSPLVAHEPNTAFILMWMDPTRLTFRRFGG